MISKIKLKNFKVFQDEEFELGDITLVTGINGMGKSSLIQSLLLLKQSYAIGYLQGSAKVDLSNDFVNLETAGDLCYSFADDAKREISISLTDQEGDYHWRIDASEPKARVLPVIYEGVDFNRLSLFSEDFTYLDAERWGPRESYNRKEKRSYNTKLGVQGELAPAYLLEAASKNEVLGIVELGHESAGGSTDLYENVNYWMSEILGLPVKAKVTEIDESKVRLGYNIEGSKGQTYSALQVGFGVTYCLPVVMAVLRAKRGDLVLVENPEAHLHPAAQIKIGLLLCKAAANGVQVILESHSDHILNSIRYASHEGQFKASTVKILFFQSILASGMSTPLVENIGIDANGKLSRRPQNFFDSWDKMLTKLL